MFDRLWRWLAQKLEPHLMNDLQAGGHCCFCGKWIPWVISYQDWDWYCCCDDCEEKYGGS